MKFTLFVAIVAGCCSALPLYAQDAGGLQAPAEQPPATFRGTQFVDSAGCVFIRADIDGNVAWIPRVNRQRESICLQTPTVFAETDPVEDVQAPTQEANAATALPKVAPSAPVPARPAQNVVSKPSAAPAPTVYKTAKPEVRTPGVAKSQRRTVAAPSPAPPPTVFKSSKTSPSETMVPTKPVKQADVTLQTRVVPQHVHDNRLRENTPRVPKGYRPAWDDDRLNPRRAEQSLEGIARTRMKWTDTVPRRLIDQSTGRDVTTTVPLVYPYTTLDAQKRSLGSVKIIERDGQIVKQVTRNKNSVMRAASVPTGTTAKAAQTGTSGHYVQVGVFAVPSNADAAYQRLTGAGLPARFGTLKRSGKPYRMVLAGPFASFSDAKLALGQARNAGFNDAFVRKIR